MVHRKDICKCGHERQYHNNRIMKPFYYDMKYNCCLEDCSCTKFELKKLYKENKKKTNKEQIKELIEADNVIKEKAKQEFTKKEQQIIERYEAKKLDYGLSVNISVIVSIALIGAIYKALKLDEDEKK